MDYKVKIEELLQLFGQLCKQTDIADILFDFELVKIEVLYGEPRNGHKSTSLKNGQQGVYLFFYKDECLKVGVAGAKSNARYISQHYKETRAKSNLAKSILADSDFDLSEVERKNIGDWIRQYTTRVNVVLPKGTNVFLRNFLEAFFHLKFKPKYEGFKSSRIASTNLTPPLLTANS